jgi:hypothetical protein
VCRRLNRGEIPAIFPAGQRLSLDRAQVLEWRGEEMGGGGPTAGGAGTDGGGVTCGGAQTSGGGVTRGGAQIAGAAVTEGGGHSAGGAVTRGGAQIAGLADTGGGGVSAGGGVSRGGAGIRGEAWTSVSGAGVPSDVALLVSGMMTALRLPRPAQQAAGAVTVVVNISRHQALTHRHGPRNCYRQQGRRHRENQPIAGGPAPPART